MIAFFAENVPYKIFALFPFLTSILLLYFCIRLVSEYAAKKVNVRRILFSFAFSTFISITHFAFCRFNWNYSLIIHKTAIPFIVNLLWLLGGGILYFVIIILFFGLCIFAVIEKFGRTE